MTASLGDPPDQDDPTIGDDVALWRRLHPAWIVTDRVTGAPRISSAAFQNYPDRRAFSVCITCDAPEGYSPTAYLGSHRGYGVAELTVGLVRQVGRGVVRVPEQGEVAHGHVVGDETKSIKRRLARGARILIAPTLP